MKFDPAIFNMTPTHKIMSILHSFPCLKARFGDWAPERFEPDAFYVMCSGMSHGEFVCALFVLNVWSPAYAKEKGWAFDAIDFAATVDMESREAFLRWVADPVWP